MIFVTVYPITHDEKRLEPGDVFEISEAELPEWAREIEAFQPRRVESREEAKALSASILDGSFVLSPEVSQKAHPIRHGGIGTARKEIEGNEGLDQPDSGVAGLMKRIRRA
jgi:hypothetical protein